MLALDIAIIIILITLGLFLVILEIFFLPGTTIAGIASLLFFGGGIYYAFDQLGTVAGYTTVVVSSVVCIVAIVWFIKSNSLDRISLKKSIDSNVGNEVPQEIKIGDEGITISRLNPMGKVLINGKTLEAKYPEGFMDENTPVVVKKIQHTVIIVEKK